MYTFYVSLNLKNSSARRTRNSRASTWIFTSHWFALDLQRGVRVTLWCARLKPLAPLPSNNVFIMPPTPIININYTTKKHTTQGTEKVKIIHRWMPSRYNQSSNRRIEFSTKPTSVLGVSVDGAFNFDEGDDKCGCNSWVAFAAASSFNYVTSPQLPYLQWIT